MSTSTTSILNTIKATLGLPSTHTEFDSEIITHLNSAIGDLTQVGVGHIDGFEVEDTTQIWADYIGDDLRLNPIKSYLHLRVKQLFDPPGIGFVITSMKEQVEKAEWRASITADPYSYIDPDAERQEPWILDNTIGTFPDEAVSRDIGFNKITRQIWRKS